MTPSTLDPTDFQAVAPDLEAGPLPAPPAWATYIPDATLADLQNQKNAETFGQQANHQLADLWGQQAQTEMDAITARYQQGPQWGPPSPVQVDRPPMQAPTPEDTTAPSAPDLQPAPDGNAMQQFFGHVNDLLTNIRQGASAPGPQIQQAVTQAPAAAQQAMNDPLTTGVQVVNAVNDANQTGRAHVPTPEEAAQQGIITPEQQAAAGVVSGVIGAGATGGADALYGPVAAGADLAKAGAGAAKAGVGALANAANDARLAQNLGDVSLAMGGASEMLPEITEKFAPEMQHAAQVAVDQGIIDQNNLGKIAAGLNDPKFVARLEATKNPVRDLTAPWQQDAYALYTANKKMAEDSAAWDAIGKGVPEAAAETPKPTPEDLTAKALGQQPEGAPVLEDQAPYTGAGHSMLADNPVVKGLNTVQGALKQAVIGASVFHPVVENAQLARTALAEGKLGAGAKAIGAANRAFVDSGFAKDWMANNAADIARAEKAGGTMMRIGSDVSPDVQQVGNTIARYALSSGGSATAGFTSAKLEGQSNEDALKRAALFGVGGAGAAKLAPYINSALWGRMVPVMKTEAFKMLAPRYGDEIAAKRINDIFGGQNLAKLGRNPEMQQVLRTTFLAPDWTESWARNLGATIKKGPEGDAARRWWAATGISGLVGLEGLNMALAGHPTFGPDGNEPGHQAQLETTGILRMMGQKPTRRTYMDINMLGPVDSVINSMTKSKSLNPLDVAGSVAGRFASNHLNVLPSAGLDAVQNYSQGHQIVPEGTPPGESAIPEAGAAISNVMPIAVSGFTGENIPTGMQAFSAATGLRSSEGSQFTPAVQQAFQGVGQELPKAPTNMTVGKGSQVTLDAKQKRIWEDTAGKFLTENTPKEGFAGPEEAQKLRAAAEKEANSAVLDNAPELLDKAVNKKDVAEQKAVQKAGGNISPAWAAALGKTSAAPTPVAASARPAASAAAANPGMSDAWKKALAK